jgi:TRAP-type C4-dicarboxylate transport system permease small subunit
MKYLVKFFDYTALVAFTAMMGCVLLEVVARNVIHMPTTWAEELSRFMCVWTVFMGSASAWARNTHIMINILPRRLKGRARQALSLATQLLTLAFLASVWFGAIYIMIEQQEATTTALEISISWFYLALFVGATGMLIFHVEWMVKTLLGRANV